MMWIVRCLIRGYQIGISPVLSWLSGPFGGCRYEPTCSAYCLEAMERHGFLRGGWLGVRRLCRCAPWGSAGWDPVPDAPGQSRAARGMSGTRRVVPGFHIKKD